MNKRNFFRIFTIAGLVALVGLLGSCFIPGDVYIGFTWPIQYDLEDIYYDEQFSCDDFNVPDPPVADAYYLTDPGTYEVFFRLYDIVNEMWETAGYLEYTLEADYGYMEEGDYAQFMISLFNDGTTVFDQTYGMTSPLLTKDADTSAYNKVKIREYTQRKGGYKLTVKEYILVPKQ